MKLAARYLQETPLRILEVLPTLKVGGSADPEGLAYCVDGVQKSMRPILVVQLTQLASKRFATITGGAA